MEALKVAQDIEKIVCALKDENVAEDMLALIIAKAKSAMDYDETMGVRTAALRATDTPVTLIKDLARKDAAEKLYAKIVAEETLKARYSRVKVLESQMNGLQSILRRFDET